MAWHEAQPGRAAGQTWGWLPAATRAAGPAWAGPAARAVVASRAVVVPRAVVIPRAVVAAAAGIATAPSAAMASGKRAPMSLLYRITRTKSSVPRGPPAGLPPSEWIPRRFW